VYLIFICIPYHMKYSNCRQKQCRLTMWLLCWNQLYATKLPWIMS
jgi:hypothetical protein